MMQQIIKKIAINGMIGNFKPNHNIVQTGNQCVLLIIAAKYSRIVLEMKVQLFMLSTLIIKN